MAKHTPVESENNLEFVQETFSKTERILEENKKIIIAVVAAIAIIVGGYIVYSRFYQKPREEKALKQMFVAERYFEQDSFKLALNGDANYPGFLRIIDEYGSTKAGNLAYYYAGISYLHIGEFDNAIKHLKDFSSKDKMIAPLAKGALGDAYLEKGQIDEAIAQYKKAGESDNSFLAPMFLLKAALALEEKNDFQSALSIYETIKQKFPRSAEGRLIDKYIARANTKLGKK